MNINCKHKNNWAELIKEFSNFKGTIAEFCKIKGVSKSQFYKHRKAQNMINNIDNTNKSITFTKIDLKKQDNVTLDKTEAIENKEIDLNYNFKKTPMDEDKLINIEMGKANIILDSKDKATISFFIKEIYSLC